MRQDLHPEDRAFMSSGLSDAEALSEGLIDYFDLPMNSEWETEEEIEAENRPGIAQHKERENSYPYQFAQRFMAANPWPPKD